MRYPTPLTLALPFTLGLLAAASGLETGCGSDGGGAGGGAAKTDGTIVVLFTSDEHSHVFSFSPEIDDYPAATTAGSGKLVGGVARRAALLGSERKAAETAGKDTITVSSGDNQMGTLAQAAFESASVDYGTMKALGYDVTTLGNHELDFGPKSLAKSIKTALSGSGAPPIVASNIHFSELIPDDDDLAALYSENVGDDKPIHPYRVVTTKGGHKVGVLGYVGVNAEDVAKIKGGVKFSSASLPPLLEGNREAVLPELYKELQAVVDTLKNTEKVDLVIALSHAGLGNVSTEELIKQGEDYLVAENVSGIDLIVSGHSHLSDPKPVRVKNDKSDRETWILNGGAYGSHVGRVEVMVHADGSPPMWNEGTQAMIAVDEKIVPDAAISGTMSSLLASIEAAKLGPGGPYLPTLLSRVTGKTVTDDASKPGDLYFYPLGKTDFDLSDIHAVTALSADSMLAAADALGIPTDMGLESAGVARSIMMKGKTGVISAADAFNVAPLGWSTAEGSIGYPLVHATISLLELRGVFEASLAVGKTNDQFDLMSSGVKVEFDASRTPALSLADLMDPTKGQVVKVYLDTDHSDGYEQFDKVVYDPANGIGSPTDSFSVVTSSYISTFAKDVGASPQGQTTLMRADKSEIKQVEAFMSYIFSMPTLPPTYDLASPMASRRFVCVGGC